MSKDSQLAVSENLLAKHDREVALQGALAMAQSLDAPRTITKGQTAERTVFQKCGSLVLKCEIKLITHDLVYNPARNQLIDYRPPEPSFNASVCTEADLLDVQRDLETYGSGKDRVDFREWLAAVRGKGPAPLQIEILNPAALGATSKTLVVKRDSEGKMSGATIEPIG